MSGWVNQVLGGVVTVLQAVPALYPLSGGGLYKLIEVGIIADIREQTHYTQMVPYGPVSCPQFTPDTGEGPVGHAEHWADIEVGAIVHDAQQKDGEAKCWDIITAVGDAVGAQRVGDRFNAALTSGRIIDLQVGGGQVLQVLDSSKTGGCLVYGKYTFKVQYQKRLVA